MQSRPDSFEVMGGDTIQMVKTAEYLRKLGVNVDISLELSPKLDGCDIVHVMNLTRTKFTYAQVVNAKKQRKKVVLSPIYWNTKKAFSAYLNGLIFDLNYLSLLKDLGSNYISFLLDGKRIPFNEISELIHSKKLASIVLREVDHLLPNSLLEFETMKQDFADVLRNTEKTFDVIPNGVDANIFQDPSPQEFIEKYGLSDFVLCVGRFGYRKNQLSLVRALKGLDINVVFIGQASSRSHYYEVKSIVDRLYYYKCKKEANASFTFCDAMPQDELASAYAACRVFALPSLYETPGLSALEAALCGANICITREGSTQEYFQELAYYCDPYSLTSIRSAVLRAFHSPRNYRSRKHILENFTWDNVAKETLRSYEEVLDR